MRITLRGGYTPSPGEPIQIVAVINAPPQPASPGAYDIARDAYFQSVGGVGFALGSPQSWTPSGPAPWRLRLSMRINATRWALRRRIIAALGVEEGGLATAMTTGHDAFISPKQVNDRRASGLAHTCSISGLHMAIVGGAVGAIAVSFVAGLATAPFAMQHCAKPPAPDVWVAGDGTPVAVKEGGEAILFRHDVKLFGAELWARRRGLDPSGGAAARDAGYVCDHWSCTPKPGAPVRVAAAWNLKLPLKPERLAQLCAADLVILRDEFPAQTCRGRTVLTGADFAQGGAAELFRQSGGGWTVRWAQAARGWRTWS